MKEQLRAKLAAVGQEHLLAFWDQLGDAEQSTLAAQLESVDVSAVGQHPHFQGWVVVAPGDGQCPFKDILGAIVTVRGQAQAIPMVGEDPP